MNFKEALDKYLITEKRSCKRSRMKRKSVVKECGCEVGCGCQGGNNEQASMIANNLSRISQQTSDLNQMVQTGGCNEEWIQEKIAMVAREIDNVYHYMQGQQNNQIEPGCGPGIQSMIPKMTPLGAPTVALMGDKPGPQPVGTYVFSTEKKHHGKNKRKKKISKKRAGQIYDF